MTKPPGRSGLLRPERVTVLLVALLLAIDALAIAGILAARREARAAAQDELARTVATQARACEAVLATLRADLVFLASSPRLAETRQRTESEDPLRRRWARLETESALLLFAQGHPELHTLELADASGELTTVVLRRAGADPVVVAERPAPPHGALRLRLPVDEGGELYATVDPAQLAATLAPGAAIELAAPATRDETAADREANGALTAAEAVRAGGWDAPPGLVLRRRQPPDQVLGTVERLADRYRTTVLVNLLVVSLGLPLGALALRATRRAARLAAEREIEEDRRVMERGLWHQERLATVGRLTSRIAHEMNNPLAGVANHLALLEEDLARQDVDAVRARVPKLREGVDRITSTVRRALSLAAPGRDEWQLVDVAALAERTASLLDGVHPGVTLAVEAEDDTTVTGDRAALAQVMTNLLLNAAQLQGDGGWVRLAVRSERAGCVIEVADRGPGIDPAVADRLFEPFVSGRGSTGLGLAVCRSIVREHGGTIVAENREDGGARFTVWLPAAEGGSRGAA
ncbi:MAG TPA: HAMP domain-containing sensor histidine kinase [Thermoanaerobaculia bacterium]|nr:HAMP domain-containing sensor histidine kinase [Thermoanaerobaculia bacterium]